MMIKKLAYLLVPIVFTGCALLPLSTPIEIQFATDEGIQYSGRGAGAGISLMSTLGPAGIAVGIAIDEGIKKELQSAAAQADFNLLALIQGSRFAKTMSGQTMTLLEFGFRDVPGGDLMSPYLTYSIDNLDSTELTLPETAHSKLSELTDYRENGALIIDAYTLLFSQSAAK